MAKTKNPTDLLGELSRRRESDARAYSRLVKAVANGQDVSPEEAEATLAAAGKTVEDLGDAVAAIQRRRQEDLELARIPELESALLAAREATAVKQAENAKVIETLNGELAILAHRQELAERALAAAAAQERAILSARAQQEKAEEDEAERRLFGTPHDNTGWNEQ